VRVWEGPRGESLGALLFFWKVLRNGIAHAKSAKDGKENWLLEIGDRLLGKGLLTLRPQSPDTGRKGRLGIGERIAHAKVAKVVKKYRGVMSCEGWVTKVADLNGRYFCVRQWFSISQRGCRS